MVKGEDETASKDSDVAFHTTHWTEILAVRSADKPRRRQALGALLKRYWKPVFYYLRCKGYDEEAAKDITQDFLHDVVLGQSLVEKAKPHKGRFRTFLLTALDRYVSKLHRAEKAKRRMPEGGFLRLEEIDWQHVPQPAHYVTPAEAFDYDWASALLDEVLDDVELTCRETGKCVHWDVFRARVLHPIVGNAAAPSLAHLCNKHGIPSRVKASNMIITVKRRFQIALRLHMRQFVDSDADVDDEIRHLMRLFSHRAVASWG